MAGLTREQARAWWERTLAELPPRGALLVARDAEGICGNVLLVPAWAPNQPHRAEVAKLIVHSRVRRRGLGDALMAAVEHGARERGFTLLTLDTVRGRDAERLYRRRGWQVSGVIPNYALEPDGALCDTVVFYKSLSS
jgi:GNAT superfamily N-acetyltransferase